MRRNESDLRWQINEIKKIRITNYRCFKEAEIDFDNHTTLIVGKNGAGKTAILDAVAVSTFLLGIDGGVSRSISKDDARYEFHDLDGTVDPQHQFPVSIESTGDCLDNHDVKWVRSLNSESGNTTVKEAKELTNRKEQIRILDNGEIYMPAAQTYGRDANSILREVMKASERPADIKRRMDLFYVYMDENNYEEADKLLTEIEAIVGTSDPDIAAARTSLDLEKILGE